MEKLLVIVIVVVAGVYIGWRYFYPMFSKKKPLSPCEHCPSASSCPGARSADASGCVNESLATGKKTEDEPARDQD